MYSECSGYLKVIGVVEMEAAVSSHEGETSSHEGEGAACSQFEYECLPDKECPMGQSVPSSPSCPGSVCFGKQLISSMNMIECNCIIITVQSSGAIHGDTHKLCKYVYF